MSARSPQPEEEPPRERGGGLASLLGGLAGVVAVAFVAIAIVVALIVLLG